MVSIFQLVRLAVEIPEYWTRFITSNTLMGKYFEIGETDDESGAGADLKLLTPEQTIDEATNCWPGIWRGAGRVCPCGIVSHWHRRLLLHLCIGYITKQSASTDKPNEAVAVVLSNYERLLEYVEP